MCNITFYIIKKSILSSVVIYLKSLKLLQQPTNFTFILGLCYNNYTTFCHVSVNYLKIPCFVAIEEIRYCKSTTHFIQRSLPLVSSHSVLLSKQTFHDVHTYANGTDITIIQTTESFTLLYYNSLFCDLQNWFYS